MKFKKALKDWRADRTQAQAATALNVPVRTYISWELGDRQPTAVLQEAILAKIQASKTK